MAMDAPVSRVVAVGLGCRAGVEGATVAALIRRSLAEFRAPEGNLQLFTLAAKANVPGLVEAARLMAAPLTPLPLKALQAEASQVLTRSEVVEARYGVPAIAEAAALAGAGEGGRLLGPRLVEGGATCAIAVSEGPP